MYYFRVKIGHDDYVEIDSLEDVEKAQLAFLTDGKTIFSNGELCRGKDIMKIEEDYRREMGWYSDYKMGVDDEAELRSKGIYRKYRFV